MADRAVLIELRRFLAVIRAASTLPQEHAASLPAPPPHGSRGTGQGGHEPRRDSAVLHAPGENAGRCAAGEDAGACTWKARSTPFRGRGDGGKKNSAQRWPFCYIDCRAAASPIGPFRRPVDGRKRHPVKRGRALPRLSYPLGDRSSCPGSHGGFSGTLSGNLGPRAVVSLPPLGRPVDFSFPPPARRHPPPASACTTPAGRVCRRRRTASRSVARLGP